MKDEDIKLPKMPNLANSMSWNNDLEEWARQAVRMNMPASKPSDPEPFDLARAMAGEPIVTRDGRKARFLAHVPEATAQKVVAFVDGQGLATSFSESGHFNHPDHEHFLDLFMAPKPKRTVWINLHRVANGFGSAAYVSKRAAQLAASANAVAIAHPIEIDA